MTSETLPGGKEKKICRLCCSDKKEESSIKGADGRKHFICGKCALINTERQHFLPPGEEKKRYQLHKNDPGDLRYRDFLMKAIAPALPFIKKENKGLDYGCGPGPAISVILGEKGYKCVNYDPFFFGNFPDGQTFDFIFATEVLEHFYYPGKEIKKIRKLLVPEGVLVLMTHRWTTKEHFEKWHYAADDSHVAFYHSRTFDFICEHFGFNKLFDDGRRVAVLRRVL